MIFNLRIGLSHWYSADNVGDLAILTGQLQLLRDVGVTPTTLIGVEPGTPPAPNVDVDEFTCSPWPSPETHGLSAWIRGLFAAMATLIVPRSRILPRRFRAFSKIVGDLDGLMPKGGGYLYSRSGMRGVFFTLRICWPLLLARRLGVMRFVWGHSIGPADTPIGALILREALRGADIVVRDDDSTELLTRWELPHRRAPDLAFVWSGTANHVSKTSENMPIMIGLTARTVGGPTLQAAYEQALVYAVNDLLRNLREQDRDVSLLLCPQVVGPRSDEDDRPVLRRISDQIEGGGKMVEFSHEDVANALATYRELDFLIATRLHSAILASCVGVPFVVYEYIGGKARGAAHDLGLPSWVVVDHPNDLGQTLRQAWHERDMLIKRIEHHLPEIASAISAIAATLPSSIKAAQTS